MRVLVVGAGIAGLTFALCLRREGHDVVVLERSTALRGAGYMIDFFGSGYDVGERLGLLSKLEAIHYPIAWLSFLSPDCTPRFRIEYEVMRRLLDGRHFNFMRGELEHLLFDALGGQAVRFGTTVESFEQDADAVHALLSDGSTSHVDLLVGADGVHSHIRDLAFGAEDNFVRQLGYHTAAFVFDDDTMHEQIGNAFATLTVPGRQVALYPIRGRKIATFWVHKSHTPISDASPRAAARELRAVYGSLGWVIPRVLDHADRTSTMYFDTVSQVVMPKWTSGRVALIGDACQCVSLLAGQGASMAMGSAYVLAAALGGDVASALERYERRVRPAILKKQKAGRRIARWFVPEGAVTLAIRDAALRMSASRIGGWLLRRHFSR